MSRRRSWLCLIRSLFFLETNHNKHHHKRTNRRRWLFGRLRKNKGQLPTLEPPPPPLPPPLPPPSVEKPNLEMEEKEGLSEEDTKDLVPQCETQESKSFESSVTNESQSLPLNHSHENLDNVLAATKIQTFYRGYLARKALRALKGFVRLQAIIRGRAVRRQTITTLKCLQAIVNIQSEVCTRRSELIQHYGHNTCFHHHHRVRDDVPKVESNRGTRLDDGLLTKEDEIDIILKKKEALLRRHRSKAYSFNHRHSTDSEDGNVEGRLKYWLEQYVNDDQAHINGEKLQLRLKNIESLSNHQTIYVPRRSFHKLRKQNSYIEDNGLVPCSPTTSVPTYMAATESTKAKTRSTSSPRMRPIHFEAYSDGDSPYKQKLLSSMSSTNSDLTSLSKLSSKSLCSLHQKSPSFKGLPYAVK